MSHICSVFFCAKAMKKAKIIRQCKALFKAREKKQGNLEEKERDLILLLPPSPVAAAPAGRGYFHDHDHDRFFRS